MSPTHCKCHFPAWHILALPASSSGISGITNFLPNLPDSSITTVRVCCLPRQQLAAIRNIAISPDAFVSWPYNVQQMLNWALEPADEDMLQVSSVEVMWQRKVAGLRAAHTSG